jgi:hypothetical protein
LVQRQTIFKANQGRWAAMWTSHIKHQVNNVITLFKMLGEEREKQNNASEGKVLPKI